MNDLDLLLYSRVTEITLEELNPIIFYSYLVFDYV